MAFSQASPRSLFVADHGRVVGTWIMGNNYRVRSGYYGGYPAGYLRRLRALFPDKQRPLHLFSGKVDLVALPGDTVDINAELAPTYVDDAQRLEGVPLDQYDLVLADPPYRRTGRRLSAKQRLDRTFGEHQGVLVPDVQKVTLKEAE
jgi:hypothetical protein